MKNILTIGFLFICLATYGQTIKFSEVGNQFLKLFGDPGPATISLKNLVISAYADADDIISITYPAFVSIDNIQIIKGKRVIVDSIKVK